MAGSLAASGFHVPASIKGNDTNPTGFFEPRWVVDLHKRFLKGTGLGNLDSDPDGQTVVAEIKADPEVRRAIREWLEARFETNPRLVLKDPRMVWFTELWVDVARELGVEPGFVIMLRHPSEVSASRTTYYSVRDVAAVSGWINVALLSEQLTADSPRKFVHYPDLLADWRTELAGVGNSLGITFDPPIDQRPHPVDELLDPALRRMSPGWDEIAVPRVLSDLADRTFDALLVEAGSDAPGDRAPIAALREEYRELWAFAQTMTRFHRLRQEEAIRRKTVRRVRSQLQQEAESSGLLGKVRRRLGSH